MKPISLRLRGAIGIRDGLGLDEIDITFAGLSPGLVAIVGKNGSGKTTILDNLHPYLELPSRDGSLANHFFLRDSVRELHFEIGQVRYRSEILIDARTGRVEAYLYQGREPLNDGRVSTYKAAIVGLLGSPEVFFNSVFVAQGSSGVTALTPSKRKDLFFDLLGLQIYDGYTQYAKASAEELEKSLLAKSTLMQEITKEASEKPALRESLDRAELGLGQARRELHDREIERLANETGLESCRKNAESLRRIKKDRESLGEEIALLAQRLSATDQDAEKETKTLGAEMKAIEKEISRTNSILTHSSEITEKVGQLRSLRQELEELLRLQSAVQEISQTQSELFMINERQWNEYHRNHAKLQHQEERLIADERQLLNIHAMERANLMRQLQELRTASLLVDEVPCRQVEDLPGQCKLLRHSIEADEKASVVWQRIAVLDRTGTDIGPESVALRLELEEIAQKKSELERARPKPFNSESFDARKEELHYDAARHAEVRASIKTLEEEKWERLSEELLVAQSVLKEKKSSCELLGSQIDRLKSQRDAVVSQLSDELASKRERLNDLGLLSPMETDEGSLLWQRNEISSALESLRTRELTLHGQAEAARGSMERIEKKEEEGVIVDQEITVIAQQVEHWRMLQRACSRDGIPALELDAAGPGISGIANELLASTFGARFQISFETTKLSKDCKKQLETFNIVVYGQSGEKRIEDLSGGERVWIERAISEAIAIYMSEHSGCQLQTTFQDESDGPLDPDNKQNYFSLLRESFRLGRRFFTFIITQSPEIWEQIEQRIYLKPGIGAELVY
ncbi:MAG: SMC family ATPase [Ignavibacteria bacterium]|nr:SMC family ATPase [Ignavibacteria bacterium]